VSRTARTSPASKTVTAALVTVKLGSMPDRHWHPNADEWQYYRQGSARMSVFNTGPHANTTDFRAGDVGLVRRNCGHYVENTGDDDLGFIETFRSDHYEEVSLANWLSHLPAQARFRAPAGSICPQRCARSRPCRPSRRCVSVIRGEASDSLREGGQIEAC
jgi:oxalate decarboxylase family bicupin protein